MFSLKTLFGSNALHKNHIYICLKLCPSFTQGFKDGIVEFANTRKPKIIEEPIPDSESDKNLILHFCCRDDGSWKDPLFLPSKDPIVLFERGDECQEIKG